MGPRRARGSSPPAVHTTPTIDMVSNVDVVPTIDITPTIDMISTIDVVPTIDMISNIDVVPTIDMISNVDIIPNILLIHIIAVLMLLLSACGTTATTITDASPTMAAHVIRIMPLGDSITAGIGSSSSAGYRLKLWQEGEAARWQFTFVGSQSAGPRSLPDKQHEGHPGWRIDQISAHIVPWLQIYRPQIILLHIGSNDIIESYYPQTASQRLYYLLEQITTTLPHAIVIVAQVTPLRNPALNEGIAAYNQAIPGLVKTFVARGSHVTSVDMYHAVPVQDLGDGVHPNTAGYALMAAVWYSALHKEIAKNATFATM